jgi:hypothetical protein
MSEYGRKGLAFAAAALVLTLAGSIPTPTEAQSIPRPDSCSRSLTGQQAWLGGTRHVCGAVEVETYMRTQRIDNPYPGGVYTVWIYYCEMRARIIPVGGTLLVGKVNVPNSPQCSFSPGPAWSSWRQCAANAYSPTPPSLHLSSVVLRY